MLERVRIIQVRRGTGANAVLMQLQLCGQTRLLRALPSQAVKTFKDGECAVPLDSLLHCPGEKCFHIQPEPLVFQFLALSPVYSL